MKARLVLSLAIAATALTLAGCGGDSDADDPASLAPADAPLYAQVVLRPTGQAKSNVETLATKVTGFADPTGRLIGLIDRSMNDEPTLSGGELSFRRDIEPWLGKRAGIFADGFEDNPPAAVVLQATDTDAARAFVEDGRQRGDEKRSYEGVDYVFDPEDDTAAGVVDEFVVFGEEGAFESAVDVAQGGDSLAGQSEFADALDRAPAGSLADLYLNIGLALEKAGDRVDESALGVLRASGIDPTQAIAVASAVPAPDRIEIAMEGEFDSAEASTAAAELLGSMPADAVVAFAAPGFGRGVRELVDRLDSSGIPGQIPPGRLKSTLSRQGIDLGQMFSAIGDAALFLEGKGRSDIGGALVLIAKDANEATNTVSNLGLLLRLSGAPGVSVVDALGGRASGFSISSEDLGPRPLVVVALGDRVAVGYGLAPTLKGAAARGAALADSSLFADAEAALGETPISGFVAGPGLLGLVARMGAASDEGFQKARPYLAKVAYIALGGDSSDGQSSAKLIVGIEG